MQPRIVIRRQRRPWLTASLALLGLLGVLVASYTIFKLGQSSGLNMPVAAPVPGESPADERRRLLREVRAAREEAAALKGRQTFDARSSEIDAQACRSLRESVASCERDTAKLREEVVFYRNIVTPEKGRSGVRVQELALRPGDEPDVWRYELLLVRSMRNQSHASGRVEFEVEGHLDDQLKRFNLSSAGDDGEPAAPFSFRYFQELEGGLRLPPGLRPERLKVTLVVQGDRDQKDPVVETFDWSRLTREPARSPP